MLGASSMKTISRSSPSAAAAEPGWVVSPPLPTTSARWPGHCDSATVSVRRPGVGVAAGRGRRRRRWRWAADCRQRGADAPGFGPGPRDVCWSYSVNATIATVGSAITSNVALDEAVMGVSPGDRNTDLVVGLFRVGKEMGITLLPVPSGLGCRPGGVHDRAELDDRHRATDLGGGGAAGRLWRKQRRRRGGTCGKVSPCGGSLVGTWTIAASCESISNFTGGAECPGATLDESQIVTSGTMVFSADMTFTASATIGERAVSTWPCACAAGAGSCDEYVSLIVPAPPDATTTCATAGSACNCTMVYAAPMTSIQSGHVQHGGQRPDPVAPASTRSISAIAWRGAPST